MEDDKEWLLQESTPHEQPRRFSKKRENILITLIFLTIALNLLQFSVSNLRDSMLSDFPKDLPSPVAGLLRNIEIPRKHDTLYSINPNSTHRDELWESFDITKGIVALNQEFIREQNLPQSMEFPWDTNKNVYSTTAHHQLHCLKKLYKFISRYSQGQNQTESMWHLMHCLDALRQDALCNADDTLFYVYERGTNHPLSGNNQPRLCRNFSALQEWTKPRTACYAFSQPLNSSFSEKGKEHFRRCPVPEGEKYLGKVRDWFGVGHDWVPDYEEF